MLHTVQSFRGMVTASHHLAARAGLRVLEDGGNAIEAMIAAASTIAVVYPHMNALGGDNFWLIHTPGGEVTGIDACGAAAGRADIDFYKKQGFDAIPSRGPLAALTVAGAVSGWEEAYRFSKEKWGGRLPLSRILEDATFLARDGFAVTRTQAANTSGKLEELKNVPGFASTFLPEGQPPAVGYRFRQPALAKTLKVLAEKGLDTFYRGDLARAIAAELEAAGSPITLADLESHRALRLKPLTVEVAGHRIFNMPPPTQGLASLILLGVFDRLGVKEAEGFDFVHGLVESTKRAFRIRDRYVTDPHYMQADPKSFLTSEKLDALAAEISMEKALPWPEAAAPGDTVWLGAADSEGRVVSFIQSIYWEFGSGVAPARNRRHLAEPRGQFQPRPLSSQLPEAPSSPLPHHPNRRWGISMTVGSWLTAPWVVRVSPRPRPWSLPGTCFSARNCNRRFLHHAGCSEEPGAPVQQICASKTGLRQMF